MGLSRSLTLKVRAHDGQRAVLRSKRFCTAAIAGTGGGKTVVGYVKLLNWMIERPGMVWVVAEPTQKMVDRVLLTASGDRPSLPDFLGRFDADQVFLRSKGILRHRLGTVIFASAENPSSLQGAHVGGVWLDEAGLMGLEAFLVALQRVGYSEGKLLLTTTPYNMGWLKTIPSCQFGIDELEGYVWKGSKDGEGFQDEPVKERDHLMDGLRYVLHALESRPGLRLST